MKIIIEKSYKELSETTARILIAPMYQDKRVNISITGGKSPAGTYEIVTKLLLQHKEDFTNVHYYNFDEIPIGGNPDGLTRKMLNKQYFLPADIAEENIHLLNCNKYESYDKIIFDAGGLDLMLIGLGADGHFCGNMPYSTQFDNLTYRIDVLEKYPWSEEMKTIPDCDNLEYFVSMGPSSIMRVKHLVLIVNGNNKAQAVKKLLSQPVDNTFPASILRCHPNLTVILDSDAASLI